MDNRGQNFILTPAFASVSGILTNERWAVSPTVFRESGYRFFFFSREEERRHVHVHSGDGEAKFWLEPKIEIAKNYGLSAPQLTKIEAIIREHEHELIRAWNRHFKN